MSPFLCFYAFYVFSYMQICKKKAHYTFFNCEFAQIKIWVHLVRPSVCKFVLFNQRRPEPNLEWCFHLARRKLQFKYLKIFFRLLVANIADFIAPLPQLEACPHLPIYPTKSQFFASSSVKTCDAYQLLLPAAVYLFIFLQAVRNRVMEDYP